MTGLGMFIFGILTDISLIFLSIKFDILIPTISVITIINNTMKNISVLLNIVYNNILYLFYSK